MSGKITQEFIADTLTDLSERVVKSSLVNALIDDLTLRYERGRIEERLNASLMHGNGGNYHELILALHNLLGLCKNKREANQLLKGVPQMGVYARLPE